MPIIAPGPAPGHPLLAALAIMQAFPSPASAEEVLRDHAAALEHPEVPGDAPCVLEALRLLRLLEDRAVDIPAAVAAAARYWAEMGDGAQAPSGVEERFASVACWWIAPRLGNGSETLI